MKDKKQDHYLISWKILFHMFWKPGKIWQKWIVKWQKTPRLQWHPHPGLFGVGPPSKFRHHSHSNEPGVVQWPPKVVWSLRSGFEAHYLVWNWLCSLGNLPHQSQWSSNLDPWNCAQLKSNNICYQQIYIGNFLYLTLGHVISNLITTNFELWIEYLFWLLQTESHWWKVFFGPIWNLFLSVEEKIICCT